MPVRRASLSALFPRIATSSRRARLRTRRQQMPKMEVRSFHVGFGNATYPLLGKRDSRLQTFESPAKIASVIPSTTAWAPKVDTNFMSGPSGRALAPIVHAHLGKHQQTKHDLDQTILHPVPLRSLRYFIRRQQLGSISLLSQTSLLHRPVCCQEEVLPRKTRDMQDRRFFAEPSRECGTPISLFCSWPSRRDLQLSRRITERSLPIFFIPNAGQTDPAIRYIAQTPELRAGFALDSAVFQIHGTQLRVRFAGANPERLDRGRGRDGRARQFPDWRRSGRLAHRPSHVSAALSTAICIPGST